MVTNWCCCWSNLWIEHIPGKKNTIPDALSRYFINPLQRSFEPQSIMYNNQIDVSSNLQLASNLCKHYNINNKNLTFVDDDDF